MDEMGTDRDALYGKLQEQQDILKRQKAKTRSYKIGLCNLRQLMMESQLAPEVADTQNSDLVYSEANQEPPSVSADVNVSTQTEELVQAADLVSVQALLTQKLAEVNTLSICMHVGGFKGLLSFFSPEFCMSFADLAIVFDTERFWSIATHFGPSIGLFNKVLISKLSPAGLLGILFEA